VRRIAHADIFAVRAQFQESRAPSSVSTSDRPPRTRSVGNADWRRMPRGVADAWRDRDARPDTSGPSASGICRRDPAGHSSQVHRDCAVAPGAAGILQSPRQPPRAIRIPRAWLMNALILSTPSCAICGATSTMTSAVASTRLSPTATRLVPRPSTPPQGLVDDCPAPRSRLADPRSSRPGRSGRRVPSPSHRVRASKATA
jgi:hypothetical protein